MQESLICINGYRTVRKDREFAGGGGIILYVKDTLNIKRRDDLEHPNIECVWIEVIMPYNRNILLGTIYRPPGTLVAWYNSFEYMVKEALDSKLQVIITGDFNINLIVREN